MRRSEVPPPVEDADDDDLPVIGAAWISAIVFRGRLSVPQVYKLAAEGTWPFFRVRNKLACRPSTMRAEYERREQAALGRAA